MLKQTVPFFLLLGMAFSQTYSFEVHLDDLRGREVKCTTEVPKDFACATFFGVNPPIHDGIDIASVVGGASNFPQAPPSPVIREVSLILDGTLYTAVYDSPLKPDEKFSGLRRGVGIPARADGDALFLNGPMVKKRRLRLFGAKGSIPISPNSPEPSPPLSHAAASLPRCQCTAESLVEEYALMTVVSRR